ncbi:MAG: hypothetical protein DA330_07565, partial [Nitrososphaera sp.]|nr:hypothetical protein [Nitrososphaera sp.]
MLKIDSSSATNNKYIQVMFLNMADSQFDDTQVTITYNDIHHVYYSVMPALLLKFNISTRERAAGAGTNIIVRDVVLQVYIRQDGNKPNLLVGEAHTERLFHRWYINSTSNIEFILKLDHQLISQIEKLRGNGKLNLRLRMRCVWYPESDPARIREADFDLDNIDVPKSKWVEDVLPELGFKNTALVELPQLAFPELQNAIDNLNQAWKKYSMGETNDVFVRCRTVLEELGTYLRKNGFETKAKDGNGNEKPVPDWKKFL